MKFFYIYGYESVHHVNFGNFGREDCNISFRVQVVRGKIDRPMGSCHPRHKDMFYPINYGYVTGIKGGDGAIRNDVDIPSDDEIYAQIAFQEQFFSGILVG